MRLEIAAGDRPTMGYHHHDARALPDIELVCDVWKLPEFVKPGSCEEIRCTHFLEHISHRFTVDALTEWFVLLVPGGRLYLEVPNLMWQAHAIIGSVGDLPEQEVVRLIFGDQDYDGNEHRTGFTMGLLTDTLSEAGYERIRVEDIGMVLLAEAYRG